MSSSDEDDTATAQKANVMSDSEGEGLGPTQRDRGDREEEGDMMATQKDGGNGSVNEEKESDLLATQKDVEDTQEDLSATQRDKDTQADISATQVDGVMEATQIEHDDIGATQVDRKEEEEMAATQVPQEDSLPATQAQVEKESDSEMAATQVQGKDESHSESEDEVRRRQPTKRRTAILDSDSDEEDNDKDEERSKPVAPRRPVVDNSDDSDLEPSRTVPSPTKQTKTSDNEAAGDKETKSTMRAIFEDSDSSGDDEPTMVTTKDNSDSEGENGRKKRKDLSGSESDREDSKRVRQSPSNEHEDRGHSDEERIPQKRSRRDSVSESEEERRRERRRGRRGSDSEDEGDQSDEEAPHGRVHDEIFGGSDDDNNRDSDNDQRGFSGFANDDDDDIRIPKKSGAHREKKKRESKKKTEGEGDEGGAYTKPKSDYELMLENEKRQRLKSRPKKKRDDDIDLANALDDQWQQLMNDMQEAFDRDIQANRAKKPAIHKLKLLPTVVKELKMGSRKRQEQLMENGMLACLGQWLQPLPDKSLPHVSIRNAFFEVLLDWPVPERRLLGESRLGKLIMMYTRHPKENMTNQGLCKKIINDWSRVLFKLPTVFGKLGDDEKEEYRRKSAGRRTVRRASEEVIGNSQTNINDAVSGKAERALKPGDEGWRWHARIPSAANTDYIVAPKPRINQDTQRGPKAKSRMETLINQNKDKKRLGGTRFAVKMSIEGRGLN